MKQQIIMENDVAFLPGAKAIVTNKAQADATTVQPVIPADFASTEYSPWGDDNLFPQNVLKDLEMNSIALRALEKRKTVHFGRGIIAYREQPNLSTGVPDRIPVEDPDILEFFRINRLNLQWVDLIGSLEIFANGWLEFILNKSKDKINRVYVKDPAYCRVGRMDPNKPIRIPYLYYSAQWEYAPSIDYGTIIRLQMFDPDKYDGKTYKEAQFAYPVVYKSFN